MRVLHKVRYLLRERKCSPWGSQNVFTEEATFSKGLDGWLAFTKHLWSFGTKKWFMSEYGVTGKWWEIQHEIKRCLVLGRKAVTNLDSILKSRDITWLTKVCLVKAMVLPVVMYGCENWTIKKPEHQRIDVLKLWCWRRLESPLDMAV